MKLFKCFPILLLYFFSCKPKLQKFENIDNVKIVYVNRDVYSTIPGSCDNFEESLAQLIKTILIKDIGELSKIQDCLNEIHLSSEANIDVKVKVYLMQGLNIVAVFCLDQFDGIVSNDKGYRNECFTKLIHALIEKHSQLDASMDKLE